MTGPATVEERLAALEADVALLKQLLPPPRPDWLERVSGSFKNEPAFEDVLTYGQALRRADATDDAAQP